MRGMKRLVLVLALVGVGACSKPSTEDCRKAVLNLQRIRGLDTNAQGPDPEQYARKCRATGNPDVVRCIINAKTEQDLARCEPQPAAK
jgi:hypothetical protein